MTTTTKPLTRKELSTKVFRILVSRAQRRMTITYGELASKLPGVPDTGSAMGQALLPLMLDIVNWCKARRIPPLTSLIVRKSGADEGLPGSGFWEAHGFDASKLSQDLKWAMTELFHEEVFDFFDVEAEPVTYVNRPDIAQA